MFYKGIIWNKLILTNTIIQIDASTLPEKKYWNINLRKYPKVNKILIHKISLNAKAMKLKIKPIFNKIEPISIYNLI